VKKKKFTHGHAYGVSSTDEIFPSRCMMVGWCHRIMLKRQRYGQIAVILAANINQISVGYMKNKIGYV